MRNFLLRVIGLAVLCAAAACSVARPLDAPPGAGKILIDADMGELNDDAQALFLLAAADVEILGLTTVGGNTWPEEGTAHALRQLELIGRTSIPVVTGDTARPVLRQGHRPDCRGALDRPRPSSHRSLPTPPYGGYAATEPAAGRASDFIADQVRRHPREVTFFMLGPATNLARAVRDHPDIVPLIRAVVVLGDDAESEEFNRWFDPDASRVVFDAPFPRRLVIPLEVADPLVMDREGYERVVAAGETPVTRLFTAVEGPRFAAESDHRVFVWDAVAAAVFLRPEIATDADGLTVRAVDHDRFWDVYTELLTRPDGLPVRSGQAR